MPRKIFPGYVLVQMTTLKQEDHSASEGEKVARVTREMTESLRALGPLDLPGMRRRWDTELAPHPAAEAPIHQLAAEGR